MKTKNTHPLPSKLSDLILVALWDLEKAEQDPRYHVEMGTWHAPNGQCSVCLAGAVMAFGLGAKITKRAYPSDYEETTQSSLLNLDRIRCGHYFSIDGETWISFSVSDYNYEPDRWKLEMILTARALKEADL